MRAGSEELAPDPAKTAARADQETQKGGKAGLAASKVEGSWGGEVKAGVSEATLDPEVTAWASLGTRAASWSGVAALGPKVAPLF